MSQCEALKNSVKKFKQKFDNEMDGILEGWSHAKNGVDIDQGIISGALTSKIIGYHGSEKRLCDRCNYLPV